MLVKVCHNTRGLFLLYAFHLELILVVCFCVLFSLWQFSFLFLRFKIHFRIHLSRWSISSSSYTPLRSKNRSRLLASLTIAIHLLDISSTLVSTCWKLPHKINVCLARVMAISKFSLVLNNVNPSMGFNATMMMISFSRPWNES